MYILILLYIIINILLALFILSGIVADKKKLIQERNYPISNSDLTIWILSIFIIGGLVAAVFVVKIMLAK